MHFFLDYAVPAILGMLFVIAVAIYAFWLWWTPVPEPKHSPEVRAPRSHFPAIIVGIIALIWLIAAAPQIPFDRLF